MSGIVTHPLRDRSQIAERDAQVGEFALALGENGMVSQGQKLVKVVSFIDGISDDAQSSSSCRGSMVKSMCQVMMCAERR